MYSQFDLDILCPFICYVWYYGRCTCSNCNSFYLDCFAAQALRTRKSDAVFFPRRTITFWDVAKVAGRSKAFLVAFFLLIKDLLVPSRVTFETLILKKRWHLTVFLKIKLPNLARREKTNQVQANVHYSPLCQFLWFLKVLCHNAPYHTLLLSILVGRNNMLATFIQPAQAARGPKGPRAESARAVTGT